MSTQLKEILTATELQRLESKNKQVPVIGRIEPTAPIAKLNIRDLSGLFWVLDHVQPQFSEPAANTISVSVATLMILQTRCIQQNKPFL